MSGALDTIADRERARLAPKNYSSLYKFPLLRLYPEQFKRGMVFYRHDPSPGFEFVCLHRLDFIGTDIDDYYDETVLTFQVTPIGRQLGWTIDRRWVDFRYDHMERPSERYQVLEGLRVPDELKFEVYLFLDWTRQSNRKTVD